ncbi:hypothetical protein MYCTH_2128874 [Thermothelomyces thermophilus ATCC 42464]|uniref:Uncharacterized protein n=1 Tax=Thermothelomyces thermophilus (strain ATCC 42464 / BCRC 31852 / DSM 1799) TaxID=573729 RepID=G2QJN6_THET4|nr:uncharacterized protein MYCTH_2128874 [Thermothelomyces thermophilus ATCC 42464]AEO59793.1 hypothetical protein MYCTH_2128874 [Thermothelomyces thermophilus ATCC 42464]
MATLSLYDTTIVCGTHALDTLLDLLKEAQARIFPDMVPLSLQVLIVCKFYKQFVTYPTGRIVEGAEDDGENKTLEELVERVEKTLGLLETVSRDEIDGTALKTTTVEVVPYGSFNVTPEYFILIYQLPTLYFHLVTA